MYLIIRTGAKVAKRERGGKGAEIAKSQIIDLKSNDGFPGRCE